MFAHEKLHVYGKALAFAASATACSAGWDKGHAVVDPLGRASDSVILNNFGLPPPSRVPGFRS